MAARGKPETSPHRELALKGELSQAETHLLAALRAQPKDVGLHLDAVRFYHTLNEPERAAIHLGRARELLDAMAADAALGFDARLRIAEALDHLAHRDAQAAAERLATLVRDDVPGLGLATRIEALVLAADADLQLGHAFRAFKYAEKAAGTAGGEAHPEFIVPALLLLARSYQSKGNPDRAEEAAMRAQAMAETAGLAEAKADTEWFLGEHDRLLSKTGERGKQLRHRAHERIAAAAAILETIAARLTPERRMAFLSQPRRQAMIAAALTPSDVTIVTPAGNQATSSNRLVATLSEMTSLINSMSDLDLLLERVMDIALEIIGAERGLVILFEAGGEDLQVRVARNLDGGAIEGLKEFSRNVVREVSKGREVVAIDTASDSWMSQQQSVTLYSIRSVCCFPLRIKDNVIGAVYLDNQKQVRTYREEDLDFLRAFTNLAAIAIENARLFGRLREENLFLKKVASERFRSTNIVGSGPAMEKVFKLVEKAMETTFPVLISGETGTGKEIVTKAIHFGGTRKDKPFVAQNCAAIPSELLESEMFGYKRGAFTGAEQDKKGLFEIASGGTLFLDEIGELDMQLQAKLLRVLQEGVIRRVGETAERKVDVRIVAATNRNLKELVEQGAFRLDLYYRLNVLQIELPPLRARPEDIPLLAQKFLEKCNQQMGKRIRGFTHDTMAAFQRYPWPGNVRELENAVARAVVFAERDVIDRDSLPGSLLETESPLHPAPESAGRAPAAAPGETQTADRARQIFAQMEQGGVTFWEAVRKPFLKRDLSRDVVREVIRLGLEKSGWKYTRALGRFNLVDEDYRKFMNFLAKANLKVERPLDPLP